MDVHERPQGSPPIDGVSETRNKYRDSSMSLLGNTGNGHLPGAWTHEL